ncbi:MAG: FtsX-like permease family protein [Gemmatimonas sp.]|nr:FtsX-like permease family protein [Gemmatimonas sp.]
MNHLLRDIRQSVRRLARTPGFTAVVLVTLALGIGANSSIFSVVNAVLLRPLPFAEPDRLVMLYTGYPDDETRYPLSPPDFMSFHDDGRSFAGVAAASGGIATLTGNSEPRQVEIAEVSDGFFEMMGASPLIGRAFSAEEHQPGAGPVALLAHAYWRQQFGSDPNVVGRTLNLDGQPRTIVGVLPPNFDFPSRREVYFPIAYDARYSSTTALGRRAEFLFTVGRLAPGVSLEAANAEVREISERLQREFPETNSENIDLSIAPLREVLLGNVTRPLLILLGAVGLILLIACVNVANLLLARASVREAELAVRTAIGAGRGQLLRQLLTESLVLGAVGGIAGLFVAAVGIDLLLAALPEGIPRLDEVRIDGVVVVFTATISIGTGLLFGLLPAIHATSPDLATRLRQGSRGALGTRASQRSRRALVVVEMALAIVLLVGSALLLRSFLRLMSVDPGFRADQIVAFELSLPESSYADGPDVRQFYADLLERLGGLPGVESAAAGSDLPLQGIRDVLGFDIENAPPPPPGFIVDAATSSVSPGYFTTLEIPLRRGRLLDERDRDGSPEVAVVNDAFVRRYLPNESPVGRRISFDGEGWVQIVGIVGDVPQEGVDQGVQPGIFLPHEQFTASSLSVVVRTVGDPLAASSSIRAEIAAMDPDLPIERLFTGEDILASSTAQPRFFAILLGIFAAAALALAAIGMFGLMSFLVAQRRREIGVRIALGAQPAAVLRLVVGGGLTLCAIGAGLGVGLALLGSRLLSGLLFEIGTLDLVSYVGATSLLLGVGALASYLPARTAMRVDPNVALRYD